jgi:hypothetical protein
MMPSDRYASSAPRRHPQAISGDRLVTGIPTGRLDQGRLRKAARRKPPATKGALCHLMARSKRRRTGKRGHGSGQAYKANIKYPQLLLLQVRGSRQHSRGGSFALGKHGEAIAVRFVAAQDTVNSILRHGRMAKVCRRAGLTEIFPREDARRDSRMVAYLVAVRIEDWVSMPIEGVQPAATRAGIDPIVTRPGQLLERYGEFNLERRTSVCARQHSRPCRQSAGRHLLRLRTPYRDKATSGENVA